MSEMRAPAPLDRRGLILVYMGKNAGADSAKKVTNAERAFSEFCGAARSVPCPQNWRAGRCFPPKRLMRGSLSIFALDAVAACANRQTCHWRPTAVRTRPSANPEWSTSSRQTRAPGGANASAKDQQTRSTRFSTGARCQSHGSSVCISALWRSSVISRSGKALIGIELGDASRAPTSNRNILAPLQRRDGNARHEN